MDCKIRERTLSLSSKSETASDDDFYESIYEPIVLIEEIPTPLKFSQKYGRRVDAKNSLFAESIDSRLHPFQCAICNKTFAHVSNLHRHVKYHSGERPFKCENCGKCFTRNSDLRVHERTHSGERPYSCHICDRKFTYSSNLNSHLRIHTDGKPFNCSLCNKNFNQLRYLKRHLKIHDRNTSNDHFT